MRVYLLDFDGTLSILPCPCQWVEQKRAENPDDRFVLWTGNDPQTIAQRRPGLVQAVDLFWNKPLPLTEAFLLKGWSPSEVIVVDNSPGAGRLAVWMLRSLHLPIRVVGAGDFDNFFEG